MHFIDVGMASLSTSTRVLVAMKASSKDTLGALVACFDVARRNRMSGESEIDNASLDAMHARNFRDFKTRRVIS